MSTVSVVRSTCTLDVTAAIVVVGGKLLLSTIIISLSCLATDNNYIHSNCVLKHQASHI